MKARSAIPITGLVAAVLIGASACGTSRSETTSAQQGKAAAQQSGSAASPDAGGDLMAQGSAGWQSVPGQIAA